MSRERLLTIWQITKEYGIGYQRIHYLTKMQGLKEKGRAINPDTGYACGTFDISEVLAMQSERYSHRKKHSKRNA